MRDGQGIRIARECRARLMTRLVVLRHSRAELEPGLPVMPLCAGLSGRGAFCRCLDARGHYCYYTALRAQ